MIAIEGRVALGLDEFMLRLGHMTLLAHLVSSLEGRPRRLEKDYASLLTRPVALDEESNHQMANYLAAKRLCRDTRKPENNDRKSEKYRYPELEIYRTESGVDEDLRVRAIGEAPLEVWWQDYCLASEAIESSVGAVTIGGKPGSSTGVSHILDWGVILGLLNRDFSATLEAGLLARLRQDPADSMKLNPFVLRPEDRTVLAYLFLRADLDLFARLAPLLLQAKSPVRKADGAKLFGNAVESLLRDTEDNANNVSHRAQSVVYQQYKELKAALRRKSDQPLGSSSTAWHRASSRLESFVDLGLLTKRQDGENSRFEYVYSPTNLIKAVCESLAVASSGVEWLEGDFIEFFGAHGTRVDQLTRDQLRELLTPIVKALGRPIQLFPIEALALGLAVLGPSIGFSVSIGGARSSLEELARTHPESARLSRGIVETKPEFISLDLEKM